MRFQRKLCQLAPRGSTGSPPWWEAATARAGDLALPAEAERSPTATVHRIADILDSYPIPHFPVDGLFCAHVAVFATGAAID
jgi:hypothetical protein